MRRYRVQAAAALRVDDIYRYTRGRWGEDQANIYIRGLFEVFQGLADGARLSRPIPAELGVSGYFVRYRKHIIYWKTLENGDIGIVTVLHERMHQIGHLSEDFGL